MSFSHKNIFTYNVHFVLCPIIVAGGTPSTFKKNYWSGQIRWMNSGELNLKRVYEVEGRITELGLRNSSTKLIPKNSVLIGLAGQGKTRGTVAMNMIELCINQSIAAIFPNELVFDPDFVYQNLDNRYDELRGLSTGTGGRGSLNLQIIKALNIVLPSIPEQQKISSFLTSVDERIAQLTKKKALLEQYKKGVMQKIFSQEIRFKDDNGREFGEWKLKKLGIFIEQYIENSTETNQFEVFTSSNKGLMLQKDYFGENRLTDRDNVGFNIIPAGYITYRSRSDNGKFTFNTNNLGITGIISTYYPVFTIKNGSNYFFVELLNFHWRTISIYSVGTSQRVLAMSALYNIELKLPCEKEQTKIANFLSAIDKKIEGVEKQLEQTKRWKKGLLQQMFC